MLNDRGKYHNQKRCFGSWILGVFRRLYIQRWRTARIERRIPAIHNLQRCSVREFNCWTYFLQLWNLNYYSHRWERNRHPGSGRVWIVSAYRNEWPWIQFEPGHLYPRQISAD